MKGIQNIYLCLLIAGGSQLIAASCTTIDLYEKSVTIPGHDWQRSFKPSFSFTIKDSTIPYQLYIVLRHTEKYNYNNIYLNLYTKLETVDSTQKHLLDLQLATPEGWLGSGMDDIYEHRAPVGTQQTLKAGTYHFTLEQIMRDDPLQNVMNVGLRIEKKQ